MENAERNGVKLRIDEMKEFLETQTEPITEYDEQLVRQLVEKVTVYDDHYIIDFKSHASVNIHK